MTDLFFPRDVAHPNPKRVGGDIGAIDMMVGYYWPLLMIGS
jgi:hypothetical protein